MNVSFCPSNDLAAFEQLLQAYDQDSLISSLVIFAADQNQWQKAQLDPILARLSKPVIGGVFPEVVYQQQNYVEGAVIIGLSRSIEPVVIEGLSESDADYEALVDEAISEEAEFKTLLVFVDGLASRISGFLDGLYAVLGPDIDYIGGGAGSLSFEQKPCVMTNSGVYQDAALLGLSVDETIVEVGHGWQALDGNHMVTRVEKNQVYEIDYQNALVVYEDVIGRYLSEPISEDNFFTSAQSFPLGINKYQGQHIVRDPIAISETGALICVGELNQGDHIDILTAKPEELIQAAGKTAQKAQQQAERVQGIFLIDCISRGLFLGEAFDQELEAIHQSFDQQVPMFGALVLGEIANSGTSYLEFYNKTAVVAIL